MKKRKWIMGTTVVLLLLLASGFTWRLLASSRVVTKVDLDRVQAGMTEAEVEGVLGGPADEYAESCWLAPPPFDEGIAGYWYADELTIEVRFQGGKVVETRLRERGRNVYENESFWSKKRRFLRNFGM